jgi:hypothetical protein
MFLNQLKMKPQKVQSKNDKEKFMPGHIVRKLNPQKIKKRLREKKLGASKKNEK